MISGTIFKQTLRANYTLWLLFTIVPTVMFVVLTAVFSPETLAGMADMLEGTPMADMLAGTSFLSVIGQSFYNLQGVLLPLIYIILTANSLIAAQVDRGSMAYTLSTPVPRGTVVRTQALYLVAAITAMFVVITGAGALAIHAFQGFGDVVDTSQFLTLNAGLYLLMLALSGISFLASCFFNLSKYSFAFGAGIPIGFWLLHMMAGVDSNLESLRFLSLNTLFDTDRILAGGSMLWQFAVLGGVAVVLYGLGARIFQRKDLPL